MSAWTDEFELRCRMVAASSLDMPVEDIKTAVPDVSTSQDCDTCGPWTEYSIDVYLTDGTYRGITFCDLGEIISALGNVDL